MIYALRRWLTCKKRSINQSLNMEEWTIELLELGTKMEIQALVEFQAAFCTGRKQKLYRFVSFLDAETYEK